MNTNHHRMTGATSGAMSAVGQAANDPPPGRLETPHGGVSGRPYEESLGDLSRELAARFAQDPPAVIKCLSRPRHPGARDSVSYGPKGAVVLSFCLGAVITIATASLYYFHRDFLGQTLFSQTAAPATFLLTASPPVLVSTANAEVPSTSQRDNERSVRATLVVEPAPVVAAQPAPMALPSIVAPPTTGDEAFSGRDRDLAAEDIREIQSLLQSLGLRPGPLDGIAGPWTAAAVRRYQVLKGQLASGGIDRDLLKRLRQEVVPAVSAADVATR